jgi:hypothetical protein
MGLFYPVTRRPSCMQMSTIKCLRYLGTATLIEDSNYDKYIQKYELLGQHLNTSLASVSRMIN